MSEASLAFTSPTVWFFWILYFWAFNLINTRMIRNAAQLKNTGIVPGESAKAMGATLLLLQLAAALLAWFQVAMFPAAQLTLLFWIGFGLMIFGALLRKHCYLILGRHFTPEVRVVEDQKVIDKGAYSLVRHPGYLASLIMVLGFGLGLGSMVGLAVVFLGTLIVLLKRIHFEEKALTEKLGEAYTSYARGRKRLIPWIY